MIWSLFLRELRLAFRHGQDIASPLWFFLITITLIPLGVGPDLYLLAHISPGIVWVATLFSSLLALERLFRDDYRDGMLEQLILLPLPLPVTVMSKVAAHWVVTGGPLLVISPLTALLTGMHFSQWLVMVGTLLLGTPALGLLGAPGAALTAGMKRSGVLLSVLVLPLTVPVLIFAVAAMAASAQHQPVAGYMAVLGALLMAGAMFSPFATAAALRISVY